jgi:hypothetical protein
MMPQGTSISERIDDQHAPLCIFPHKALAHSNDCGHKKMLRCMLLTHRRTVTSASSCQICVTIQIPPFSARANTQQNIDKCHKVHSHHLEARQCMISKRDLDIVPCETFPATTTSPPCDTTSALYAPRNIFGFLEQVSTSTYVGL